MFPERGRLLSGQQSYTSSRLLYDVPVSWALLARLRSDQASHN